MRRPGALLGMLARLGLTAMRDRLDSLLDEAARREMSLREALRLLCEREVARREERRIQMAAEGREVPVRARRSRASTSRPSRRSTPGRSASSRRVPLGRQRRSGPAPGAAWGRQDPCIDSGAGSEAEGKTGGAACRWPGEVIAARVRHRRAGAGPSLSFRPGGGAVGVIQQ